LLGDIRNVKMFSRDARIGWTAPDASVGVKAVSVVIGSENQEVFYNFFMAIHRPAKWESVYRLLKKAVTWLIQFEK
jgi:hypothetical protein